jgi:hypothetical protein
MSDQWFVERDGKTVGPIPSAQLKHLAETRKLKPTDHLQQQGTNGFVLAGAIEGLFSEAHGNGPSSRATAANGQPARAAVPHGPPPLPPLPFRQPPVGPNKPVGTRQRFGSAAASRIPSSAIGIALLAGIGIGIVLIAVMWSAMSTPARDAGAIPVASHDSPSSPQPTPEPSPQEQAPESGTIPVEPQDIPRSTYVAPYSPPLPKKKGPTDDQIAAAVVKTVGALVLHISSKPKPNDSDWDRVGKNLARIARDELIDSALMDVFSDNTPAERAAVRSLAVLALDGQLSRDRDRIMAQLQQTNPDMANLVEIDEFLIELAQAADRNR